MADKSVAYTQKDPLLKDIMQVCLSPTAAGGVTCSASYSLKDANGAVVRTGQVEVPLSGAPLTAVASWLTSNILPVIRSQEQM